MKSNEVTLGGRIFDWRHSKVEIYWQNKDKYLWIMTAVLLLSLHNTGRILPLSSIEIWKSPSLITFCLNRERLSILPVLPDFEQAWHLDLILNNLLWYVWVNQSQLCLKFKRMLDYYYMIFIRTLMSGIKWREVYKRKFITASLHSFVLQDRNVLEQLFGPFFNFSL